jgi:hypothetical protein
MIIVYASKTGFTKKYADLLAAKTGLKAYNVKDLSKFDPDEAIIYLGWMKAGAIVGLNKVNKSNLKAVCASGTGRTAEPNPEAVIARNKIENVQFFYLRGGCLPLKEMKGIDKIMLYLFAKMLKNQKNKDENIEEALANIENGFDGVKEENLEPVIEWLSIK